MNFKRKLPIIAVLASIMLLIVWGGRLYALAGRVEAPKQAAIMEVFYPEQLSVNLPEESFSPTKLWGAAPELKIRATPGEID